MSNQKTTSKIEQKQEEPKLTDKALSNLSELDLTLITTSTYFKPEEGKTYVIRINPEDKVEMIKNPKFADKDDYIPTRFEFKIKHVNNDAEQLFTVSKTLCKPAPNRTRKKLYYHRNHTTWNRQKTNKNVMVLNTRSFYDCICSQWCNRSSI